MGDYEKERELGAGQFGVVWLAFHKGLGIRHAVKFVREENVIDPTEFFREPQLLRQLEHPNIVKVEDAGRTADGELFIAMEYLRLGSVADRYKGRPVPLQRLKPIVCEALRGLEYAHHKGYIHRDIKPANVLIARGGNGRLSDFGLATKVDPGGTASPQGYIAHLAPEVVSSRRTSSLSDVYAMGVTLYRMVNGDSLLPRFRSMDDYLRAIEEGRYPDRDSYRVYVPKSLKRVINKAMHIDEHKRFQGAKELRVALEQTTLACSWREIVDKDSKSWTSDSDEFGSVAVKMRYSRDDTWNVETLRSRKRDADLRRVRALCATDLTEEDALSRVSLITTSFVNNAPIQTFGA